MQAIRFNFKYFSCFIFLLLTEILIEMYVHDTIVRPFIGDFLVVILIYCFIKSFLNTSLYPTAIAVLLFSYFIEFLQYFHLVELLGLSQSRFASVIIGTYFSWIDLLMYTLGILAVLLLEKKEPILAQ